MDYQDPGARGRLATGGWKPHPHAGEVLPTDQLLDVDALITAYFQQRPDPTVPAQRVHFGTSGHRGCAFDTTFNEWHVLAITQAICDERRGQGIDGPLFVGCDTHAVSAPAGATVLEVLAANQVEARITGAGQFTPTPAVSFAILRHGRQQRSLGSQADGIILTPSHNPPADGGLKYNRTNGGAADLACTTRIERAANIFLQAGLKGVRRIPLARARRTAGVVIHDFRTPYVQALGEVLALDRVRAAGVRIGVDPLGGAGTAYWPAIAEHWHLALTVTDDTVDPTFRQIRRDADGVVRMDPASPWVMRPLVALREDFDVAFGCDADHDRHGIVTPADGLLSPHHYLPVLVDHLLRHRPHWRLPVAIGDTMVCTRLIERVATALQQTVWTAPVGFKWFAAGLHDCRLAVAVEESAGASFLDRSGLPWSTDKDGIIAGLLAAEIVALQGRHPGQCYRQLAGRLGETFAARQDVPASPVQRDRVARLTRWSSDLLPILGGDTIAQTLTQAPGNGAAFGGIQVVTRGGWVALRPSGTEDLCKIYGESFVSAAHLGTLLEEGQARLQAVFADPSAAS